MKDTAEVIAGDDQAPFQWNASPTVAGAYSGSIDAGGGAAWGYYEPMFGSNPNAVSDCGLPNDGQAVNYSQGEEDPSVYDMMVGGEGASVGVYDFLAADSSTADSSRDGAEKKLSPSSDHRNNVCRMYGLPVSESGDYGLYNSGEDQAGSNNSLCTSYMSQAVVMSSGNNESMLAKNLTRIGGESRTSSPKQNRQHQQQHQDLRGKHHPSDASVLRRRSRKSSSLLSAAGGCRGLSPPSSGPWSSSRRNGTMTSNKSFSNSLSRFTLPDENGKRKIRHDIMSIAESLPALPGLYFDKKQKGFRVRYQNVYVGWVALSRFVSIEEAYVSARDIWESAKLHAEKYQTPHAAIMASYPLQQEAQQSGKNRGGRPRTVTQLPPTPSDWLNSAFLSHSGNNNNPQWGSNDMYPDGSGRGLSILESAHGPIGEMYGLTGDANNMGGHDSATIWTPPFIQQHNSAGVVVSPISGKVSTAAHSDGSPNGSGIAGGSALFPNLLDGSRTQDQQEAMPYALLENIARGHAGSERYGLTNMQQQQQQQHYRSMCMSQLECSLGLENTAFVSQSDGLCNGPFHAGDLPGAISFSQPVSDDHLNEQEPPPKRLRMEDYLTTERWTHWSTPQSSVKQERPTTPYNGKSLRDVSPGDVSTSIPPQSPQ